MAAPLPGPPLPARGVADAPPQRKRFRVSPGAPGSRVAPLGAPPPPGHPGADDPLRVVPEARQKAERTPPLSGLLVQVEADPEQREEPEEDREDRREHALDQADGYVTAGPGNDDADDDVDDENEA